MPSESDNLRSILDAFAKLRAADAARGRGRGLEQYQALFPGFEADVAAEFARLEGEAADTRQAPRPLATDEPPTTDEPTALTHIGPYRILSVLGEGGMGTVYLAEQREPVRRRVALKVIKLGMDSKQVLARFEAERQALAMMNHDNIARVFEAGTTERGQPFFVMEHVEGIPLTQYCDQHKLTIQERIALFQQACAGVQHAHQKGVIHRDLKPSNVLVTRREDKAIPKIIDFGLARATDQQLVGQTLFTEQGQVLGTPEYMSPEQAGYDAQGIDTRTDIYSLGVMLYELLAGELPFSGKELRAAGMLEIQRKIREDQPPRPSTRVSTLGAAAGERADRRRTSTNAWTKALRGDLDWIVLKAMAKEPERRYESATGMAMDLGRFLAHEPVLAGPPGVGYRVRKFVRRYRLQVGAAAAVLVTLVAGVIGTASFAVSAREQAGIAEERRHEAEKAKEEALAATKAAVAERNKARAQGYVANVRSAEIAVEAGFCARARQALDACPAEHRGWEWGHLMMRTDMSLASFRSHPGAVFSPDGRRIVSASSLWDTASHAHLVTLPATSEFAISADGSIVASKLPSGELLLWNPENGDTLRTLGDDRDGFRHVELALSFDGSRLAKLFGGSLTIWDTRTCELLHTIPVDSSHSEVVAFSPDGARIVLAGNFATELWDTATGTRVWAASRGADVTCGAFSPDGTLLLFGAGYTRGAVRVLDAANGEVLATLPGHGEEVVGVQFSSDGSRFLSTSLDNTVQLWDGATWQHLRTLHHDARVWCASFSPDGSLVASGSDRVVRLWRTATGSLLTTLLGHDENVKSVAFSADGTQIVSGAADGISRLWSTETGRPWVRLGERVDSGMIRGDGARLLTLSAEQHERARMRLWDGTTGELLATMAGVTAAAFSADGKSIFSVSRDTTVRESDGSTGEVRSTWTHRDGWGAHEFSTAFFTSDGPRILLSYGDGKSRLWNVVTDELLATFEAWDGFEDRSPRHVRAERYGRDFMVSDGRDEDLRLWNAKTGRFLCALQGSTTSSCIAFSPDGARAVAGMHDGTLRVWDTTTGKQLAMLRAEGHRPQVVLGAVFSRDATRVLAWDEAGELRLWDAGSSTPLAELSSRLDGNVGVRSADFSPDGRRIVAALPDLNELRVFDAATGELLITLRGLESPDTAVFSPDGAAIVSHSQNHHELQVWPSDMASARAMWHSAAVHRDADVVLRELLAQDPLDAAPRLQAVPIHSDVRRIARQLAKDRAPDALNASAWRAVDPDGPGGGDPVLAMRWARAAVDLEPEWPVYSYTLAWALVANGFPDEARVAAARAFELLLTIEPDGRSRPALARLEAAILCTSMLQALFAGKMSIAEFLRACTAGGALSEEQLTSVRPMAAARLQARARQGVGAAADAHDYLVRLARAAVTLAPNSANYHHTLAWALAANGLDEEARATSARALGLARASTGKMFGFTSAPLRAERATRLGLDPQQGLLVTGVSVGSTAEFAGLRAEDIISRIADGPATTAGLQQARADHDFFETVPFEVRRGNETLRIDVPVGAGEPK